jgi:hypothetical protein
MENKEEIFEKPIKKLSRKVGVIRISDFLFGDGLGAISHVIAALKFVPIKVEYLKWYQVYEMMGISDTFDEITLKETVPTYSIILEWPRGKEIPKVSVKRQK